MNLFNLLCKQQRWSNETFGRGPQTEGVLKHIEKEIGEVRQDPDSLEEWCDIVLLAFGGAMRMGHTPYQICQELLRKQQVTIYERTWPTPVDGMPTEHVK